MKRRGTTPVEVHFDEALRAVEVSAASYVRRVWWADREDLEQEAWKYATEILNYQQTYDPSVGVPLFGYLRKAIGRLLYNYVLAESAPVSAPRRDAGRLKGLQRAAIEDAPEDTLDPEVELRERFSDAGRRARLETILHGLVGSEKTELAVPFLIGEERTYPAAAARAGRSVEEVKAAVKQVRQAIAGSPELWRLWAA